MNPPHLTQAANTAFDDDRKWNERAHTPQHVKEPSSNAIPIPRAHIHRTSSELQLCEDMVAAEWRELCMFERLVKGMQRRQADICASKYQQQQCRQIYELEAWCDPKQQADFKSKNTSAQTHRCVEESTPASLEEDFGFYDDQELPGTDPFYISSEGIFLAFPPVTPPPSTQNFQRSHVIPPAIVPVDEEHVGEVFVIDL